MPERSTQVLLALVAALLVPACSNGSSAVTLPGAFSLTAPADLAVDIALTPTYAWNASANTTSYTLQVATDAAFTTLVIDQAGILTTSATPTTQLAASTVHHWRVRATGAPGATMSPASSFTTVPPPPGAFTLTSPADTAINVSRTPTYTWAASSDAASYTLQVSTSPAFASFVVDQAGILTTNHAPAVTLAASTLHYWRVTAANVSGTTGATGSPRSFTTLTPPPGAFTLTNPADTAINVSRTPTYTWAASSDAASYSLQVSTSPAFAGFVVDQAGILTTNHAPAVTLAASTLHYWRVTAVNVSGTTDATGSPRSFTTVPPPPGAFTLTNPADTAVNVSRTPTYTWAASSDAASYTLQVSTSPAFAGFVVDQAGILTTNHAPAVTLAASTLHYWRVTAANVSGTTGATGSPRSFTTVPPSPGAFTLTSPADTAINVSRTPTYTWAASSDAASYTLQVSTSPAFAGFVVDQAGILTTNHAPAVTLAASTLHYWRVTAVNVSGTTDATGSPRSFTTLTPPPGAFTLTNPADTAINVSRTPTYTWAASSDAASYSLQVSTSPAFAGFVVDQAGILTTNHAPAVTLAASTLHYWRVTAVNVSGTTDATGSPRSFTTVPPSPGAFTLTNPADLAPSVPVALTFTWAASSDAASYTLQVSTSPAFASFVVNEAGIAGTTRSPAVEFGTSTTYHWRVTAINAVGSIDAGPASFTTGPPSQIATSTSTLDFAGTSGGANPATQTLQITNPSGATTPLRWTVLSDRPWLQFSPATGETLAETDDVQVSAVLSQVEAWTTDTSVVGAPLDREDFALVWTGNEMIVWGGTTGAGRTNSGGRYDPATNTWSPPMSTTGAPTARRGHTGVWTGTEMIIWGGFDLSGLQADGYRYNPRTDAWSGPIAVNPGFAGRAAHSAIWTGSEMIVWGGAVSSGQANDGARYNPSTNTWQGMSTSGFATNREHHVAVWTGTEMIMWGGQIGGTRLNTGARYDPGTNAWTAATSTAGAPDPAAGSSAVWSGTEMIVWGGLPQVGEATQAGGRFDPTGGAWLGATTLVNAPVARRSHEAVWIGGEMIAWGGYDGGAFHQEGRRYRPPIALAAGVYTGTLTVLAPDASNSPQTVNVTFTVAP